MGNITVANFEADILDRMDNTVMGAALPDQIRQKLSGRVRLLRAMNQGLLLFCKNAGPKELQALVDVVTLTADSDIADTDNLCTYLWPTTSFEERPDGGLMSVILDGQERLIREMTPLESVRMQAGNAFYGATQRVFAYDLTQKRIYAPNGLATKARIITTPMSIYRVDALVTYSGSNSLASYDATITDGTTLLTYSYAGALPQTPSETATGLSALINASTAFKLTAINVNSVAGTFELVPKITTITATTVTLAVSSAGDMAVTPTSLTIQPGYYVDIPISDVYTEALSLLALRELIKAAENPDNFGIVEQQTVRQQQEV